MNVPTSSIESPREKHQPGLKMLGLIPSQPRQQPPPPSTAHLDPIIRRGMEGIGGERKS